MPYSHGECQATRQDKQKHKMHINWKKTMLVTCDILLGAYVAVAVTSFNKPDESAMVCTQVDIDIQDEGTNGFISATEVKSRLDKNGIYPLKKPLSKVNTRKIEETLKQSPFIKNAECYKTENGHVWISLTQRLPTLHVMASNGDDYYLDDNYRIMPNSHYTSNLIIATGDISRWYAQNYISFLAEAIMANDFWRNQVEQINVLPDHGIELVPRVGDHIIYIGQLPKTKYIEERKKLVTNYANTKMERLKKFYKYGLSQAGWNKYSYIDVEFDNQIICKKRN